MRRGRAEVDVGHQRHDDAARAQAALDLADRLRVGDRRRRDADDLAAGLDQPDRLSQRGLDVLGAGRRHRLHADGLRTTYGDGANLHLAGDATLVARTGYDSTREQ